MDVLWFRLSRKAGDPEATMGRFDAGRIFVIINRGDNWQCGLVIRKGSMDQVRRAGLPAFRDAVSRLAPFAAGRIDEIADWDAVKLLTVGVDRLRTWYRPGLICIGDAAHTMSPIGGVGINLAIQDAVAAGNVLADPLRDGSVTTDHLRRIQARRLWPTRVTQSAQVAVQNRVITRVLAREDGATLSPPLPLRLLMRFPTLRRIPARLIGLGVRPEHIRTG